MKLTIGTRGSKLALYQTNLVKQLLEEAHKDIEVGIKIIKTKGDKILDVALSKIGDKGLFTKELEIELLAGTVDLCVHSLKDLPTVFPSGTQLGAILERGQNKDVFISQNKIPLEAFTSEMRIATSSLRRKSQLLNWNPSLNIIDIRGNVDTRIQKLKDGYCEALLMAGAGIERMGYKDEITQYFDEEFMIPAPGQGAIAIETRLNDTAILDAINPLHHKETYIKIKAERTFLNKLEGGCQVPIGSTCAINADTIVLTGFVASLDGKQIIKATKEGSVNSPESTGTELAEEILAMGGDKILEEIKSSGL